MSSVEKRRACELSSRGDKLRGEEEEGRGGGRRERKAARVIRGGKKQGREREGEGEEKTGGRQQGKEKTGGGDMNDIMDTVVNPMKTFAKDSARLVNKCTKPDRKGERAA